MSPLARFTAAAVLFGALLIGGTAGYTYLEGWSVLDSLYMTVITITTVGFGEVEPLSAEGRRFTIALVVMGALTIGYSVTTLIGFVFEGQLADVWKERRMQRIVRRLRDHYIICGGGLVGIEVARAFERAEQRYVVVDADPSHSEVSRDTTVPIIEGDAESEEVLREAGIDRARGLVSVLPNDEANLFVVLTARQLNPELIIVAQAADTRTEQKLKQVGATRVVLPYRSAGRRIASFVLRPAVASFLDDSDEGGSSALHMEEINVPEPSFLIGKSLADADVRAHTGAIVVAITTRDHSVRMNPDVNADLHRVLLRENDVLIAAGTRGQLDALRRFVLRQEPSPEPTE